MRFAIFDIETRVDKQLLADTIYRGSGLDSEAAFLKERETLIRDKGSDFFPLSFHVPVSIAVGSVSPLYELESVETLGAAGSSEEGMVREFWERLERFLENRDNCLVSFNGRQFDLPVLELHALRHGLSAPRYFFGERGARHRFATDRHFDLHEFLTNFGASRVRGGFDLLMRVMGLPGKGEIDGSMVQELWDAGRLDDIHRYCRKDVLQTWRLLLRVDVLRGRLPKARCEELLAASTDREA